MELSDLPQDVHKIVFEFLDYVSLCRCAQVCKDFRLSIQQDSKLQYRIEAAVLGAVPDDSSSNSETRTSRELLEETKGVAATWRSPTLKTSVKETRDIPSNHFLDDYAQGVFCFKSCSKRAIKIFGSNLVCAETDDVNGAPFSSISFNVTHIYPEMDVLFAVVLAHPTDPGLLEFHIRSLTSGSVHVLAKKPLLAVRLPNSAGRLHVPSIQVCGDVATFSVEDMTLSTKAVTFVVLNWRSGEISHVFDLDNALFASWYLLTKDVLLLLGTDQGGEGPGVDCVNLYTLSTLPARTTTKILESTALPASIPNLTPSATFLFPPSCATQARSRLRFLYSHTAPRDPDLPVHLLGIQPRMGFGQDGQWAEICFFVFAKVFATWPLISNSDAQVSRSESGRERIIVQWDSWGPQSTRCLIGAFNKRCISGWQVIQHPRILSFNQRDISRCLSRSRDGADQRQIPDTANIVRDKSVLPASTGRYACDVETALPYRECTLVPDSSSKLELDLNFNLPSNGSWRFEQFVSGREVQVIKDNTICWAGLSIGGSN